VRRGDTSIETVLGSWPSRAMRKHGEALVYSNNDPNMELSKCG